MPADVIDQILRDADPLRDVPLPAADSLPARRVLAGAKRHRSRALRRIAIVAVAAVVAVGAGVAVRRGDGHPGTSGSVDCTASARSDAHISLDLRTDDPALVCAQRWQELFSEPAPAQLTACVDSSAQGSIKVYPGGPDVCEAHGAVRYTGPTAEQRRFAAFLEDGKALRDDVGGCIRPEELRTIVRGLLAKHGLVGWTFGRPNGPEPKCMMVAGFNEPKRLIITN